jgi:hypothetical protein
MAISRTSRERRSSYQIAGSCYGVYTIVLADTYPLSAVPATTGPATATYLDPVQSDMNGVPLQYT